MGKPRLLSSIFASPKKGRIYLEVKRPEWQRPRRLSFFKDCERLGIEPNAENQRRLAEEHLRELEKDYENELNLSRTEKRQKALTQRELLLARQIIPLYEAIDHPEKDAAEMVRVYREHLRLSVDSPNLSFALAAYFAQREKKMEAGHLSAATVRASRQTLTRFLNFFKDEIKVGEIRTEHFRAFFESLGEVKAKTFNNYLLDLGAFFAAISDPKDKSRILNHNPLDDFRVYLSKNPTLKAKETARKPSVLTLPQIEAALRLGFEMRKDGLLGYAVLGLFLGLRPSEIHQVAAMASPWDYYLAEKGLWKVDGYGKMSDYRLVEVHPTAALWLSLLRREGAPLSVRLKTSNASSPILGKYRTLVLLGEEDGKRLLQIRENQKRKRNLTEAERNFARLCEERLRIFHDVFRHTFGTYFFHRENLNLDKTKEMMGHSDSEMFLRHYKGMPLEKSEVEKFWNLTPQSLIGEGGRDFFEVI